MSSSWLFLGLCVMSRAQADILLPDTQVHVADTQGGQANCNIRVWSRERFITGPSKETGASASKTLNSPKGFSKAFLKARCGRGVHLRQVMMFL